MREVHKGDELTHSYVDQVEPTAIRRAKLSSTYCFVCGEECERCYTPSPVSSIDIGRLNLESESSHEVVAQFLNTGSYEHILRYHTKLKKNIYTENKVSHALHFFPLLAYQNLTDCMNSSQGGISSSDDQLETTLDARVHSVTVCCGNYS